MRAEACLESFCGYQVGCSSPSATGAPTVTAMRVISYKNTQRMEKKNVHKTLLITKTLIVSFVPVLKLSRPRIHTSKRVQCSNPVLFFLCEARCGYLLTLISFSEKLHFACAILDAISVLSRPLLDI